MFRLKVLIILILSVSFCFSQQAVTSYSILNNNCTSRNSSLGGYPIGVFDSEDASIAIFLPSNLLSNHENQLVINYNNHFADSDFGMVNYNFKVKEKGVFSSKSNNFCLISSVLNSLDSLSSVCLNFSEVSFGSKF